jgi:hypothetical protein
MTAAVIDSKSNLPPAARRQVEAANALIAELNAKPGQIPAGTEFQTMPGSEVPGTLPTGANKQWVPASQSMQAPAAAAQVQQVAQPSPPPPPPAEDPAIWEQRYRSLQGKYDAETRMTREIMANQQKTMDQLIASRAEVVQPTTTAPAIQQTPEEYLRSLGITEKEISDYGDLLPIVARLAQNMIRPSAEKLEAELNRTRAAAGQTANAVLEDRKRMLFDTLDRNPQIPGWRVLNNDDNFLAWLDSLDILSGVSRRNLMTDAFQKLDATRIAAIFGAYIQEDSVRQSTLNPMVDINTLIAPGTPRGGSAEAPGGANGKRILSEQEIADFYSRVRRKLVSTEQYAAFSAEIAAATVEGRIRPTRTDHHRNS